MFPMLEKYF